MEYLALIIVVAVIALLITKSGTGGQQPVSKNRSHTKSSGGNSCSHGIDSCEWLQNRWKLAESQRERGEGGTFPKWYYDEVTKRQLERLGELNIKTNKITKGQASDLIGLHEPAEEEGIGDLEIFKISSRGMNNTKAQHEVMLLFQKEENVLAWENRPASQIQKEFLSFFGVPLKKGTTYQEASRFISDTESDLKKNKDPKLDEWGAFEEIIDELWDADIREEYEIKKPSLALIKSAISHMQEEGKSLMELADDIEAVVDKLLELKPELQRS